MNVTVRVRPAVALGSTPSKMPCNDPFSPERSPSTPYGSTPVVCQSDTEIAVMRDPAIKPSAATMASNALGFKFASVYRPDCESMDVYQRTLKPIVSNVLKGTPGCLFAYGQTGSGKTHTITGNKSKPGLLPFAVSDILDRTAADSRVLSSCVYLTYIEVYNEVIRDLLNPRAPSVTLMEDKAGMPHLPHVTRVPVGSVAEAQAKVEQGEALRAKAANSAHEHASRSHAVFTITVETRQRAADGETNIQVGVLHVVDLAGSETAVASPTDAPDCSEVVQRRKALGDIANAHLIRGESQKALTRNREGGHIRRSLLALVRCVQRLADHASFIPFRDSKLTRLLRPSLEGNSNTAIVCTVNPAEGKESAATLRFAATAQRIDRTPAATALVTGGPKDGSVLQSYERQISLLRVELTQSLDSERRINDEMRIVNEFNSEELKRAQAERAALEERITTMNRVLLKTEHSHRGAEDNRIPTPRRMAKERAHVGKTPATKRSGSAPNRRRGAVADPDEQAQAVSVPIPDWLRDGELQAMAASLSRHRDDLAAVTAERDTLHATCESQRDEIDRLRSALAAEEHKNAVAEKEVIPQLHAHAVAWEAHSAALAQHWGDIEQSRKQQKKKSGFSCASSSAAATRCEAPQPPSAAVPDLKELLKALYPCHAQ